MQGDRARSARARVGWNARVRIEVQPKRGDLPGSVRAERKRWL